jgi:hypothetical protein
MLVAKRANNADTTHAIATSRSNELESTRYKCSIHNVWLTLRTVTYESLTYRFWQCPVIVASSVADKSNVRCQTCKPCKNGERIIKW